jgi:hypothetical protein
MGPTVYDQATGWTPVALRTFEQNSPMETVSVRAILRQLHMPADLWRMERLIGDADVVGDGVGANG